MNNAAEQKPNKKPFFLLGIVAVLLVVAGVAVVVLMGLNSSNQMVQVAAQVDETAEEEESTEPKLTNASTEIIGLTSLMGLSLDSAVTQIGHGASVQDRDTLSSLGFTNEVAVLLTDETGDSLSGTPTVTLGLSSEGVVTAAAYEASTSRLGYGELSFASAVTDYHIVEHMLSEVGITGVEEGSVTLPDKKDYSYYESDGVTLSNETYTFSGTISQGDATYTWEVTLNYDYSEANAQSNLGYTVKRVSVAIMQR